MDVRIDHFRDVGEQDANGDWDYFYEGDNITFSHLSRDGHEETLKARIYVDTPTRASFIEQRSKLEVSPLTEPAADYLRGRGIEEIHCLGPVGYAVWWCAD